LEEEINEDILDLQHLWAFRRKLPIPLAYRPMKKYSRDSHVINVKELRWVEKL
jgi:hypothetical protein